jgi:acetyl esterase
MTTLHPQMVEALALVAKDMTGKPPIYDMSPAEARKLVDDYAPFWNQGAPEMRTLERSLPGPRGPIPVRLYDPGLGASSPGLVYLHGGGWVLGNVQSYDGVCRRLARHGGFPVVSVDYRLAPEHKFPAPLEDCLAAIRWIAANGGEFGIQGNRLALAGDSAGGNLSLAAAMSLRDQGGPMLKAAALIYGAFGVDFDTPSYRAFGGGEYLLSRAEMIWYWNHYLRGEADRLNPYAVPLAGTFENLPPLLVAAAEFDPLLDDNHRLRELLKAAGAAHDWSLWPGMVHGCIDFARLVEPADGFLRDTARWVGERLRG